MKKFVRIQSDIDIMVSAGLQSINMSNKDAHVADRLNVKSAWVGTRILITKGTAYYPSEIKTWDSVQALAKDKLLTIGEEVDEIGGSPEEEKTVEEKKTKLNNEIKKYKKVKAETEADPQATEVKKSNIDF